VIDLMAALRKSVGGKDDASPARTAAKKSPAKAATAEKAPAKKPAAKKAPDKSTASKKTASDAKAPATRARKRA
jgi:hypothetical protein